MLQTDRHKTMCMYKLLKNRETTGTSDRLDSANKSWWWWCNDEQKETNSPWTLYTYFKAANKKEETATFVLHNQNKEIKPPDRLIVDYLRQRLRHRCKLDPTWDAPLLQPSLVIKMCCCPCFHICHIRTWKIMWQLNNLAKPFSALKM